MLEFCCCCCSVAQLCLTPRNAMDCSMPDFPVLHYLLEFAQTRVHWVDDAINHLILCHPLLLLPSIFPSIRVFSNESTLNIRWPKYWRFSISISPSNEYSGLISFRIDWLDLLEVQGTLKSLSPAPQFKSINSLVLSLLHGPTLTFIHDYWKNFEPSPKTDTFFFPLSLPPSLLSLLSVRRKIWFHAVNSEDFHFNEDFSYNKGNDSVFFWFCFLH